jgi:ubiquitin carboxyl-terminal hydrolase 4/11
LLPHSNAELHLQLTFKTSSTKKRKLCQDTVTDFDSNPEVPLESIEDQETFQQAPDLPRFDISSQDGQHSLPPHIPSHLQNEASLSTQDYISSAASSPSAAYAALTISERGGDNSGSEGGVGQGNPESQDTRSQSPNRSFAHRAIMGGAADFPQRSSSPLKRPASDLEQETPPATEEDVEMDALPPSDPPGVTHEVGDTIVEEQLTETIEPHEEIATPSDQPEHQMLEMDQPDTRVGNPASAGERKFIAPTSIATNLLAK